MATTPPLTQPPDPHPRKPRTACPPGAIDCHIHVFGPASRWPFHPDSKYTSLDALPEAHIALQDTLGLAGAVIVSGGAMAPASLTWRKRWNTTPAASRAWPCCPRM